MSFVVTGLTTSKVGSKITVEEDPRFAFIAKLTETVKNEAEECAMMLTQGEEAIQSCRSTNATAYRPRITSSVN